MGSPIGSLVQRERITLNDLQGKVVAIDALNTLYQFLAIIRLHDGTPLKDSTGKVTSHLSGLFYRTVNLLEHKIRTIYVFDGKPPRLKERTLKEREAVKVRFTQEWRDALKKGDLQTAFKKSVMTSRLESGMVAEAKYLLELMGVPWVQAPSEGEAQAAYMALKGECDASASQDYDSLLFGSPRLIINLTIAGKRYYPKRGVAVNLVPELVELEKVLTSLSLSREQLIDVAMLVGTDFNEGIYGIGPKRALQMIRNLRTLEAVVEELGLTLEFDPNAIREFYLNPPVAPTGKIRWNSPSLKEIRKFLVTNKNFEESRIDRGLERLERAVETQRTGLGEWI